VQYAVLMFLGTLLWSGQSFLPMYDGLKAQIAAACDTAFSDHLTNVEVKQAVAWVQSLSQRGTLQEKRAIEVLSPRSKRQNPRNERMS